MADNLEDILIRLKRYSFISKVQLCNKYSIHIMNYNGTVSMEKMHKSIYPWELECFALLSIKSTPEYRDTYLDDKTFLMIINTIRNKCRILEQGDISKREWVDLFLSSTALLQFDIQEFLFYKYYRFNYIFNYKDENIDMQSIFIKKFGVIYWNYMLLSGYIDMVFGSDLDLTGSPMINYLLNEIFPIPYKNLAITLIDYKKKLETITSNIEDYSICLRPDYQFPFIIKDDKVHLFLPHLLGRATTASLLYRLTEGNDNLRTKIGKSVLERYLFKLLDESKAYDEIKPEHKYATEKKRESRTEDVMCRKDKRVLFCDIKSSVPSRHLRTGNKDVFYKEIDKTAGKIIQMYKNMRVYYNKYPEYCPFTIRCTDIDDMWGMVVLFEDNYVSREKAYLKAAEELNIDFESDDYNWLIQHIKVISLYQVEIYALRRISLIDVLMLQVKKGLPFDFKFVYEPKRTTEVTEEYLTFDKKFRDEIVKLTSILENAGVIHN